MQSKGEVQILTQPFCNMHDLFFLLLVPIPYLSEQYLRYIPQCLVSRMRALSLFDSWRISMAFSFVLVGLAASWQKCVRHASVTDTGNSGVAVIPAGRRQK